MWELKENIVFVKGIKNAAIYNLETGEVYSINAVAKKILEKYIKKELLEENEQKYIDLLSKNDLLDSERNIKEYCPVEHEKQLNLVWLEITQGCNMQCIHCYEGQTHNVSQDILSLDEWKIVIDQIISLYPKRIVVIGGEPCIHKNIIAILNYIRFKDSSVSITLFTNGYFMDHELLKAIINNSIEVKVSLYGHCAEVHDNITRVKGSFEKLKKAIMVLGENRIPVNVAVTLMKENEHCVNEIKNFLKTLPIRGYKFDVIREVVNGNQKEHIPQNKKIIELAYRTRPNFYVKKKQFDLNYFNNSCWNGKMVITETGNVLPCVFARKHIYGNVRTKKVSDIIQEDLKKCWEFSVSQLKECALCEYRYACQDCRPIAESALGICEKNPKCRYNPNEGVWKDV